MMADWGSFCEKRLGRIDFFIRIDKIKKEGFSLRVFIKKSFVRYDYY